MQNLPVAQQYILNIRVVKGRGSFQSFVFRGLSDKQHISKQVLTIWTAIARSELAKCVKPTALFLKHGT